MSTYMPTRSLVVCPTGKNGKDYVRKVVERFGHDSFDFTLLVYDGTRFDENCFAECRVIHDDAPLFWRLKRHITPELCRRYEYVFIWMDDLDVLDFDPQNFLRIMRTHGIGVAHPALSHDSVLSHPVMARQDTAIGRYTDFAEELGFVFRADLWERFWRLIEPDKNPWGWGYDEVAYSVCRLPKMAVIDAEVIKHTRGGSYHAAARAGRMETHRRYARFYLSRKKTLCEISDDPLRRCLMTPLRLYLHYAFARSYILPGTAQLREFIRACLRPSPTREPDDATCSPQRTIETPAAEASPVPAKEDTVAPPVLSELQSQPVADERARKPRAKRRTVTRTAKRPEAKARKQGTRSGSD